MRLEDFPDELCAWCGNGFEAKSIWQKYCSIECRRQSKAAFMKAVWHDEHRRDCQGRTCQHCGETYDATRRYQIYCSRVCAGAAHYDLQLDKPLVEALSEIHCHGCGEPISDARKRFRKFCATCRNEKHSAALKRMAARAGRKCRECGKRFDAQRDAQHHCSKPCRERERRRAERDAQRRLRTKRQATCIMCNTGFEAWVKTMLVCSPACQLARKNQLAREQRRAKRQGSGTFSCEAAE